MKTSTFAIFVLIALAIYKYPELTEVRLSNLNSSKVELAKIDLERKKQEQSYMLELAKLDLEKQKLDQNYALEVKKQKNEYSIELEKITNDHKEKMALYSIVEVNSPARD